MGLNLARTDIVYVLKPGLVNEELRYSLRSVCENFPHRKVWFYGCGPKWGKHIERVAINTPSRNKWENVNWLLGNVCKNNKVSDNFVLFNDDFFVMKPVEDLPAYFDKTLKNRRAQITARRPADAPPSKYMYSLLECEHILEDLGLKTTNYELHCPMVFNKEKLLPILEKYPGSAGRRSIYGNMYKIGGKQRSDYKVYDYESSIPSRAQFISTTDESFAHGKIGAEIRERFNQKCRYEK